MSNICYLQIFIVLKRTIRRADGKPNVSLHIVTYEELMASQMCYYALRQRLVWGKQHVLERFIPIGHVGWQNNWLCEINEPFGLS